MTTHDALWTQAFCELLISCQHPGCSQLFDPSIHKAATDPVEEWAEIAANNARADGWRISKSGRVECGKHRA